MNVKCDAEHCKNNDNKKCKLSDITLDFSWDYEAYGCYCANFEESEEHKKKSYKLHKLDTNLYLVIRTKVFEDVDLEMAIEEINPTENIDVIIDNYLYIGSARAENRFLRTKYDINVKDLYNPCGDIYTIYKPSEKYDKVIRKYTCDYIRETDNYGCIYSTEEKMIRKGMNL